MTDSDANSCSPAKKRRTETSSVSSSSSSKNSSSESSADEQHSLSASSRTSSLTSASVIERCQPLSFFLTKVEGIQSKFNQSQALGIKGKILRYKLLYSLDILVFHCQYYVVSALILSG